MKPVATLTIAVTTVVVYVCSLADELRVEDALFLSGASIYYEPWRVLTSTFIHRITPHFAFNLVTLVWFGRAVEKGHGKRVLLLVFFSALWSGHMSMLAAGLAPLHGISGGVCGLYGFLLVAEWKNTLIRTLQQRTAYWLYPIALLALFVGDRFGLIRAANFNHVATVVYGGLMGLAITGHRWRSLWKMLPALLALVVTAIGAYRFEEPWQDLAPMGTLDCSVQRRPSGDVTKNAFVHVTVFDASRRAKSIYYIDSDGHKVLVSRNSRTVSRFLPYLGTVWRVEIDGECRTQFATTATGLVVVR